MQVDSWSCVSRASKRIAVLQPLDFILNWEEGPQDIKDYYEDFQTALEQKDYLRAMSAYQCAIVTALGMVPVTSKMRKAIGLTREGLANLQKLVLFARGFAGFLINSGDSALKAQGEKLKLIVDNAEREGKFDASEPVDSRNY